MGGAAAAIGPVAAMIGKGIGSTAGRVVLGGLTGGLGGAAEQGMQGMGGGSGIQKIQPPIVEIPQANPNAYRNGGQEQDNPKGNMFDPNAAIYGSGIISPAKKRFPWAQY